MPWEKALISPWQRYCLLSVLQRHARVRDKHLCLVVCLEEVSCLTCSCIKLLEADGFFFLLFFLVPLFSIDLLGEKNEVISLYRCVLDREDMPHKLSSLALFKLLDYFYVLYIYIGRLPSMMQRPRR